MATNLRDEFRDFDDDEARILRRYRLCTVRLEQSRYFTEQVTSLRGERDPITGRVDEKMAVPDHESTRAIAPLIRELYSKNGRAGFHSVAALVKRHAVTARARDAVESHEFVVRRVLASWELTSDDAEAGAPRRVLEDWLYGEHLHWENADQVRRVEGENPFGLYEWQFHWVVHRLRSAYCGFGKSVVQPILEGPGLTP
jgi:hypothetical protein